MAQQPSLYWANPTHFVRIVQGGWTILGSEIYARRSSYDTGILQEEMAANNSFVCKRSIQSVVGTDYPLGNFMAMRDVACQERGVAVRQQRAKWLASMANEWIQQMPLTVLTFLIDTGPLVVSKEVGEPTVNFIVRRRQAFALAQRASTSDLMVMPRPMVPPVSYQTTSRELLEEIQRHMLEPVIDGGQTWSVWTNTQVVKYLNERLTRFELETGLIKQITTIPVAAGVATVDLPTNLVDLYRLTWLQSGVTYVLNTVDKFTMDNGQPGWEVTTDTPWGYIEDPLDPLTIQLVPTPTSAGTLGVYMAFDLGTMTGGVDEILPIPNCFTPAIKYGVMADMLSQEGEANDPERSSYCENRYQEGVQIARLLLGAPVQTVGKSQDGNTSK